MNAASFLVQWLNAQPEFADTPASQLVPVRRPAKFLTVDRTGGTRTRHWDSARVSIQCWAPTQIDADALADVVADVITQRLQAAPPVFRASVNALYSFPLDEHSPRTQADANITLQTPTLMKGNHNG